MMKSNNVCGQVLSMLLIMTINEVLANQKARAQFILMSINQMNSGTLGIKALFL